MMYVQVVRAESGEEVVAFGEKLKRNEDEGSYFLPGRYISGLRFDDLPANVRFQLEGCLRSGLRFYPEDAVTFGRQPNATHLEVQVTTKYLLSSWDGLFSLVATMEKRKQVIQDSQHYLLRDFQSDQDQVALSFCFVSEHPDEQNLESVLEQICDQVRWVEEAANQQFLSGTLRMPDSQEE